MGWFKAWGDVAGAVIASITIVTFAIRFAQEAGRFLRPSFLLKLVRSSSVRFSASALLSVEADGGFVLVLTPERTGPANYGPIGGVIKYKASMGNSKFRKWRVQDDRQLHTENDDMDRDLRVVMPPRSFVPFARWYRRKTSRETAHEALKREVAEELPTLYPSAMSVANVSLHLHFHDVHKALKVFWDVHGTPGLLHVREFSVLSVEPDEWGKKFELDLVTAAREGRHNLRIVSRQEIESGFAGGIRVGAHCLALMRTKLNNTREDEPVKKVQ